LVQEGGILQKTDAVILKGPAVHTNNWQGILFLRLSNLRQHWKSCAELQTSTDACSASACFELSTKRRDHCWADLILNWL